MKPSGAPIPYAIRLSSTTVGRCARLPGTRCQPLGRRITKRSDSSCSAIAEARRRGLVPQLLKAGSHSRSGGPWPFSYPCLEIAQSEWAQPFIAKLREAYPSRFADQSKLPFRDPERYAAALLRAVIAQSAVERSPLSAHSRSTHALIDELHRAMARDHQVFASLWNIDDLDLTAVDGQTHDGLTFYAQDKYQYGAERRVSTLLPEGVWALERSMTSYAYYGGFVYTEATGLGDHWGPTKALNERIGRFALAVRLATGSTGANRIVWMGEPSMIHVEVPEAHPQYEASFLPSHWRRMGVVHPEDVAGLMAFQLLMEKAGQERGKQDAAASVSVALGRFSRTFPTDDWREIVLDLATALEAALGPANREQIGLAIRTRAAHLLGRGDSGKADRIFGEIGDLYTLRSDLIHGNTRFQKSPQDLWEARGFKHTFETDRLRAVLDGWRDIVRLAINARLLLGDDRIGEPLWPFLGAEAPVDRYMTRLDKRREWRRRLVAETKAFGLPLLIEPAPPLIDYLHREG